MRVVEKAAAAVAVVLAVLVKVEVREMAVVRAADLTALARAVAKTVVAMVGNREPTAAADGPRRPARGLQSRP